MARAKPPSRNLQHRIDAIKAALTALGPLRPGTLSRQYNVCGTPGCRCKHDPAQRHGPYYQLSYTWHRRSRSEFVREPELVGVQEQLRNYTRLRTLIDQWLDAAIELARLELSALALSTGECAPEIAASQEKANDPVINRAPVKAVKPLWHKGLRHIDTETSS